MYMQRQACLCNLRCDASPLKKLIGFWLRLSQKHGIVQRSVNTLAEKDLIDSVVSLKQLHLRDLWQRAIHLFCIRARGHAVDAENADIQFLPARQISINRQQFGFASSTAERRETGSIQIADHRYSTCLYFARRSSRKPCRQAPN